MGRTLMHFITDSGAANFVRHVIGFVQTIRRFSVAPGEELQKFIALVLVGRRRRRRFVDVRPLFGPARRVANVAQLSLKEASRFLVVF